MEKLNLLPMSPRAKPWLYAVLAALLLSVAWPPLPFVFPIFIAFVPLLLIEEHHFRIADNPLKYYLQISLSFTLWNIATTYWTWFASAEGAIAAIVLNSQIQTIPWLLFHRIRKIFGDKLAYPALIGFSLGIEYLHLNWDIAWPWLNIGNVFASAPWAVQWYEYTGALGGSLWVYAVNIVLFGAIIKAKFSYKPLAWLLVPLLLSFMIYLKQGQPKDADIETVVVQPNIDPYNEKFSGMSPEQQLERLIMLSDSLITPQTQLVLWPETALTDYLDEGNLEGELVVRRINQWLEAYPNAVLLSGASTVKFFGPGEKLSSTARATSSGTEKIYYDSYNAALFFRAGQETKIYHKSKLVPGVEKMPYPAIFGFLEHMAIDLGGTSGSLGKSDSAVVFSNGKILLAPIICYESVFGEYVGEYIQNGAQVLAIITNDGWWRDTPGYKQHLLYARLRAIETRMYIARSANTGISAFVSPRGDILTQTNWWEEDALRSNIALRNTPTFYSISGDYIGRIAAFFSVLIVIASYVRRKTAKGY